MESCPKQTTWQLLFEPLIECLSIQRASPSPLDTRSELLHVSLHSHPALVQALPTCGFRRSVVYAANLRCCMCVAGVRAKLQDAIRKVSCVRRTLQGPHFWLWRCGRLTCILCAACPNLVCTTLVSEAEMFQHHDLLGHPESFGSGSRT